MDDAFFDLLVKLGFIEVTQPEKIAAIKMSFADLKQQLATALGAAAVSAEEVKAAQDLADVAMADAQAAKAALAVEQAEDVEVDAGLDEILAMATPVSAA